MDEKILDILKQLVEGQARLESETRKNNEKLEMLGNETRKNTERLEVLESETRKNTEKLEVLGNETRNNAEKLEVLGNETKKNTEKLETLGNEVRKNTIKLETIETKLNTMAEIQKSHIEQNEKQHVEILSPIKESVNLIELAVKDTSKSMQELNDKFDKVEKVTIQNTYDVAYLKAAK